MRAAFSHHPPTLEGKISALVKPDLHIVAGERRIADLKTLAGRAHSAEGLKTNVRLIEAIIQSVTCLRAYRAVIVDAVLHDQKIGECCPGTRDPVFQNPGPAGQLARAIDNALCRLVLCHGAKTAAEGHERRTYCYSEIEALRRELDSLGVDRLAVLPYIERSP
jgi:hypothetical protein